MTSRSLPPRPSLDSLRKQAKKISRDRSLTLRDAQLAVAREYGFPGWQDLLAEVSKRLGDDVDWAIEQATRAIHDNDRDRLKQLLAEYPRLLSWRDNNAGLLGMATGAYGDAGTPEREQWFTRAASAELLIDAGAVVTPEVVEGLLHSRAKGLLQLFHRKGLLPRTLKFYAALGDFDAVLASLAAHENDLAAINDAFFIACSFSNEGVASWLLERSIALDPDLGKRIDASVGRTAFVKQMIEKNEFRREQSTALGPWRAFVLGRVRLAMQEDDLASFVAAFERDPWILDHELVWFQNEIVSTASFNRDRGKFIRALFDLNPALLRMQPPPPSEAIGYALTYANADLIPLLTRVWPLPDDLPHAAGMGDFARVKRWFDDEGAPALGDLSRHFPATSPHAQRHDDLRWGPTTVQHVLDTALAWAVINQHFEVADFLLAHGANINTDWNSHEPASILHHLVFLPNPRASMQYLIDRGIDLSIHDYRWDSTAAGWARYALKDEEMARWLEAEAQKRRK